MEILSSISGDYHESDAFYAEELQYLEALEASLNTFRSFQLASVSSSSSSRVFCDICMDEKEAKEMFKIPTCFHSFCAFCIGKHIQAKLQDNILIVPCPSEKCKSTIEPTLVRDVVPSNIITRWEEALTESAILSSQKVYCPYKDCSAVLINDEEEIIRETECWECRRLFCAHCIVPWHEGYSCEDFKRKNEDEQDKENLRLLAENNKWKDCPNCKVFVDKIEGCIHMTCRCGFEFCYACGANWSSSHWKCQRS